MDLEILWFRLTHLFNRPPAANIEDEITWTRHAHRLSIVMAWMAFVAVLAFVITGVVLISHHNVAGKYWLLGIIVPGIALAAFGFGSIGYRAKLEDLEAEATKRKQQHYPEG